MPTRCPPASGLHGGPLLTRSPLQGRPLHPLALSFTLGATLAACAGPPDAVSAPVAALPAPPGGAPPAPPAGPPALPPPPPGFRLVHHETFDAPFAEPEAWVEDTYGEQSPWHVDAFDEDGEFFVEQGGELFLAGLRSFRSFRKAFTYGEGGWLTVELYGRDVDRDGAPEGGGRFASEGGKAVLTSKRHHDAAILRSTRPLPRRYRVEVTVSKIRFGGKSGESWVSADRGKLNGYDGDESGGPWRFRTGNPGPLPAITDNGVYFLCITDYARPAPHNNVFIHHHRKVVMDSDNNVPPWSEVWNPRTGRPELDGSHYVAMIWLNGRSFGSPWVGNDFLSYTPGGFRDGAIFADKYLDGEAYVFAVERDGEGYTMSVSGRFHHGGLTTYTARRGFREGAPTWHYNQTAEEYGPPRFNETITVGKRKIETWPEGSAYPDHFFFGDPHINYYEGTAEFDDVKLYLPAEEQGGAAGG